MTNKEKLLKIYDIYKKYLESIYEFNIKERNLVLKFEEEIDKAKISQIKNKLNK